MNNRLEEYVREVEQGLDALHATRRADEIAELRQHLAAAVVAHQELEADEDAATDAALTQFGPARTISQGIRKVWWRERLLLPDTVLATALVAVGGEVILGSLLTPIRNVVTMGLGINFNMASGAGTTADLGTQIAMYAYFALSVSLPYAIVGGVVGWLAPRRGVRGTLIGVAAFAAYTQIFFMLQMWVGSLSHFGWHGMTLEQYLFQHGLSVAAILAAGAGAWWGQRRARQAMA